MSKQTAKQDPCQPSWPPDVAALLRELKIVIREALLREREAKR